MSLINKNYIGDWLTEQFNFKKRVKMFENHAHTIVVVLSQLFTAETEENHKTLNQDSQSPPLVTFEMICKFS